MIKYEENINYIPLKDLKNRANTLNIPQLPFSCCEAYFKAG